MSASIAGELLLLLVLILLNAFFAAAEIAIISVRKSRLRGMLDEGVPEARLIQSLSANSSRLLATVQVGVTLAGFFAAATSALTLSAVVQGALEATGLWALAAYARPIAVAVVTSILALVVLVFGELVPKTLALEHSEPVAKAVARPLAVIAILFDPIVSFLSKITDLIVRLLGGHRRNAMPFVTEDEIKTMVDAGEETGVLEESEKAMIYGVFDLAETLVREVMVPRVDMVMLEAQLSPQMAALRALQSGYSRMPVYQDSPDAIIGVLHVKDILQALMGKQAPSGIGALARTPYFVPETKLVADLLREMQSMSIQMALVVDEYGGTAGLVTVEDLLEEIVGEIRDEHDREENPIERIDEQTIVFSGRVSLDEVNELLKIDLDGDDVDTIGGYVASRLEKAPARGDRIETANALMEVIAAAGRRAKRIKVTLHAARNQAPDDEAPAMEQ